MSESSTLKKVLALVCGVSIAVAVEPYASFGAPPAAPIGTMSAVGMADVRGVRTRESTLFSGDRIRSLDNSYVKVFLKGGHRIELSINTDVRLAKEGDLMKVAMLSGRVGFSASTAEALELDVQSLAILAESGNSGSIASISANLVSIASVSGKIKVRNNETGELFLLRPGTSTVFGLHGREPVETAVTRTTPTVLVQQQQQPPPAPPNQEPATVRIPPSSTGTSTGTGKSASTKILIIGGVAGAGIAIAAVAAGKDDNVASPSTPR